MSEAEDTEILCPLRAMTHALIDVIREHPLALLNEAFLETIAATAAIDAGATLVEGSNYGGKRNLVWISDGRVAHRLVKNPASNLGKNNNVPGPLPGTQYSDLRLLIPHPDAIIEFDIEFKTGCRFDTTASIKTDVLLKDFVRLVSGDVDAVCVALDEKFYLQLGGWGDETRGKKRNENEQKFFLSVFQWPVPLERCLRLHKTEHAWLPTQIKDAFGSKESLEIYSVFHRIDSRHGWRELLFFSMTKPTWASCAPASSRTSSCAKSDE